MELTLISNHAYSICVAFETLKIMQMRKKENVHMYIYSIRRVKERANDKGRRGCQGKRLWIAFFSAWELPFFHTPSSLLVLVLLVQTIRLPSLRFVLDRCNRSSFFLMIS